MNTKFLSSVFLVIGMVVNGSAQGTGIIGYAPVTFMTGSNLFNNPLQSSSNDLVDLFGVANFSQGTTSIPEGTTVSFWNPTNVSFGPSSTFTGGSWSTNFILPPGTGFLVFAPKSFGLNIQGTVLNHDGTIYNGGDFLPPPVFLEPPGTYLLGDKAPVINIGTNIFVNILGRMPYIGEQVTQISGTSTYLGNGTWNSVPTLQIGNAAFLKITAMPEPYLTITYISGQAVVSWPPSLSGWILQTDSDLSPGSWGNYPGLISNNTVTIPATTGRQFFRLANP